MKQLILFVVNTIAFSSSAAAQDNPPSEVRKVTSWDRSRPRLPPSNLTNTIVLSHTTKWSWFFWTRAGEDACGPRTMVFDCYPRDL